MKKWIFLIGACLIANVAFAYPANNDNTINMTSISAVHLSKIKSNKITLQVSLSGQSLICSFLMRDKNASPNIGISQKLLDRFKYTRLSSDQEMSYSENSNHDLVFNLQKGAFVDGLTISTRDGKSIASNVAAVYAMPDGFLLDDVGVLAGLC